ncbi:MAG: phosphogluconate dehydrogenase (NAD(+)-dependent, decarboxylating) [Propionibacteriaceae bacterium]
MQLGLVGLGKMGNNMRERMRRAGLTVVGYDTNAELSDSKDLTDLVSQLTESPKVVWVMVPVVAIDKVMEELAGLLGEGDVVIDGGNTRWTNDKIHAEQFAERGTKFVDCGVSGGVWGLEKGYALMCGGDEDAVAIAQPVFDALKPEGDTGFVHAGSHGAGHFSKMVHNGIEYGIMQAYAEGWELLEAAEEVNAHVPEIFNSWREGTVIRSWLLDLLVLALKDDPNLDKIRGYADDSGEGRWTIEAAIDLAVPVPVISAALFARFVSRQDDSPAMKMVAAMRNQFGGHAVLPETEN